MGTCTECDLRLVDKAITLPGLVPKWASSKAEKACIAVAELVEAGEADFFYDCLIDKCCRPAA